MDSYRAQGVSNLDAYGRRAFAGLTDVYRKDEDFEAALMAGFRALVAGVMP